MRVEALNKSNIEYVRFKQPRLLFRAGSQEIFQNPMDGIQRESPYDFNESARVFDEIECILLSREGENTSDLISLVNKIDEPSGYYKGFCDLFKIRKFQVPTEEKIIRYNDVDLENSIGRSLQTYYPHSSCPPNKRFFIFCQGIDHRSIESTNHYYQIKQICSRLGYASQYLSFYDGEVLKGILKKVNDPNLVYSLWNIDVALYSKLGGIPWVLSNPHDVDIFIGIRFARNEQEKFTIGITSVFDKRGLFKGILTNAYNDDDFGVKEGDIYYSHSTGLVVPESIIQKLLDDTILEFKLNSYNVLQKISILKVGYFGRNEFNKFNKVLNDMRLKYALIEIIQDNGFNLTDSTEMKLNPKRGLTIPLNDSCSLLFTTGNYVERKFRKNIPFTHEMGVPRPLLVNLRENKDCYGSVKDCLLDLFKLTSLHYQTVIHNEVHLPCPLLFAQKVARLASRNIYPHDFLKNTPWFL